MNTIVAKYCCNCLIFRTIRAILLLQTVNKMLSKPMFIRLACLFVVFSGMALSFAYTSEAKRNSSSSIVLTQQKELILQIQGLTSKNYADVRKAIEDNPGVTFRDYCFTNNTIMYVIDRDVQTDNQFLIDALAPFNLTFQIKEGTIIQVQGICGDSHEENPTE